MPPPRRSCPCSPSSSPAASRRPWSPAAERRRRHPDAAASAAAPDRHRCGHGSQRPRRDPGPAARSRRWRSSPSPSMGPGWSTARAVASSRATCSTSSGAAGHPVRVRARERRAGCPTVPGRLARDGRCRLRPGHHAAGRDPARRAMPSTSSATRSIPGPARSPIVALGPLTNLEDAFAADPTLPDRIAGIHAMLGTVEAPGNVYIDGLSGGGVEWNAYADPSAVEAVFATDIPISIVPLDATDDVPVPADLTERLATDHAAAGADLMYELLLRNPSRLNGAEGQQLWDELAALAVSDAGPGHVEGRDGHRRGSRAPRDGPGRPAHPVRGRGRPAGRGSGPAGCPPTRRATGHPVRTRRRDHRHVGWDHLRRVDRRDRRRAVRDPLPGPGRRPDRGPDRRRRGRRTPGPS